MTTPAVPGAQMSEPHQDHSSGASSVASSEVVTTTADAHAQVTPEQLARFDEASNHPYECQCELCKEWWGLVGPEEDDENVCWHCGGEGYINACDGDGSDWGEDTYSGPMDATIECRHCIRERR